MSATSQIEAESFNKQFGIGIDRCSDNSGCGGLIGVVGYTENGDYIAWNKVDFGSGVTKVDARVASGSSGGTIEFRLGGPTGTIIGSLAVDNTGGWDKWTTKSTSVSSVTDVQQLFVVFKGEPAETASDGMMNLNWIKFGSSSGGGGPPGGGGGPPGGRG